jgi:hypothetical protein
VESALPGGPGLDLLALAVDEIPVKLTAASVDIHLSDCEPALALPEVSSSPESSDDEKSKVRLEELVGCTGLLTRLEAERRNSSVELLKLLACVLLAVVWELVKLT